MIAEAEQPRSEAAARAIASADASRRMEELGRIILAYSEVTDKLQHSHQQLTDTVESLRQELGEKNRLLERRHRLAALGEMAAGLAHEIRNPLGGIQLYASMLAQDVADRPESLRVVEKISAGVRRLEALVGQVLQFTREIVATPRPTDLAAVVSQAVEYASKSIDDHRVTCRVEGPPPPPVRVQADPLLLGQVVLNLLLNAIEAAGAGGTVSIRFGIDPSVPGGKRFFLCVSDSGPGIDPAILDRIFNPFFTTKDGGTGLGLAIVHRIVEAHDGTIVAANQPSGGGARFEVRI